MNTKTKLLAAILIAACMVVPASAIGVSESADTAADPESSGTTVTSAGIGSAIIGGAVSGFMDGDTATSNGNIDDDGDVSTPMTVSSGITVTSTSANTLAGEYDFSGSGCITVSDGATLIIGDVTKIDSTVTDPIFVFEEGSSLAVMEDDSAVVIATFDEDTEVCFTGTIEETTTDASCSLTISEGAAVSSATSPSPSIPGAAPPWRSPPTPPR